MQIASMNAYLCIYLRALHVCACLMWALVYLCATVCARASECVRAAVCEDDGKHGNRLVERG